MVAAWLAIVRRDLTLAFRRGADAILVLSFFVFASVLFPIAIGPYPAILQQIGPGIIWTMALLAALLSLDRLFQADFDNGSLDLLALCPLPLELVVLAKAAAHWLTTGLPVTVVAPILGAMFEVEGRGLAGLSAALAVGTPILSLVGSVGAALTLGSRRGGVLLALLVLPLFVPALIFGAAAAESASLGVSVVPALSVLAGFFLVALALAPWAAAAGLRQALE
jgi:heme exporter protein B